MITKIDDYYRQEISRIAGNSHYCMVFSTKYLYFIKSSSRPSFIFVINNLALDLYAYSEENNVKMLKCFYSFVFRSFEDILKVLFKKQKLHLLIERSDIYVGDSLQSDTLSQKISAIILAEHVEHYFNHEKMTQKEKELYMEYKLCS